MNLSALIPAYNPDARLIDIVRELEDSEFNNIIVVNDGSSVKCTPIFNKVDMYSKVNLIIHPDNLGKGAALKTGLEYIYGHKQTCVGVVMIDADGQHFVADAVKIAHAMEKQSKALIIGVRQFDRHVPLRSRIGNRLTSFLFHKMTGTKLSDTQSGLRGVPRDLIPALLQIKLNGYEFELDMLLTCKQHHIPVVEQPIQTIYLDGNKSSHFNPIVDSLKIYFVLLRFVLSSLLSAVIDNAVFVLAYALTSKIAVSQVAARILATAFNYCAIRKRVFFSKQSIAQTLPRYLALVCISGVLSYLMIKAAIAYLPISVVAAKICAETLVFFANFIVQRNFIFKSAQESSRRS